MYGCEAFPYTDGIEGWDGPGSKFCSYPKAQFVNASIYFLFNSIVGGLVLINLFIGLMCSAMFNSVQRLTYIAEIEDKLQTIESAISLFQRKVVYVKE